MQPRSQRNLRERSKAFQTASWNGHTIPRGGSGATRFASRALECPRVRHHRQESRENCAAHPSGLSSRSNHPGAPRARMGSAPRIGVDAPRTLRRRPAVCYSIRGSDDPGAAARDPARVRTSSFSTLRSCTMSGWSNTGTEWFSAPGSSELVDGNITRSSGVRIVTSRVPCNEGSLSLS